MTHADEQNLAPTSSDNALNTTDEESSPSGAILNLTIKQQRFVHLYVTGQYTIQKLAQLLELHPNTLSNWLKRSDVKQVIQEMQMETQEVVSMQLKAMTGKAVNKLSRLIDSPIDGVALAAVKDVLDRGGHKTKQEIKVDKTVITMEQKLAELVDSTIIDADYEVIQE